jgi:hypothetical protein
VPKQVLCADPNPRTTRVLREVRAFSCRGTHLAHLAGIGFCSQRRGDHFGLRAHFLAGLIRPLPIAPAPGIDGDGDALSPSLGLDPPDQLGAEPVRRHEVDDLRAARRFSYGAPDRDLGLADAGRQAQHLEGRGVAVAIQIDTRCRFDWLGEQLVDRLVDQLGRLLPGLGDGQKTVGRHADRDRGHDAVAHGLAALD